jgi:exosome complex RNA-binding protein Rrp4
MQYRILIALFSLAVLVSSCDVRKKDANANMLNQGDTLNAQKEIKEKTTVQIIDSAYNFGKVEEGALVNYSYRFVNTGNKDLFVTSASASCGCTVPEKPDAAILPGDTGYIKITFDSKGRAGMANKTVYVQANTEPAFPNLQLTGEVIGKAAGSTNNIESK